MRGILVAAFFGVAALIAGCNSEPTPSDAADSASASAAPAAAHTEASGAPAIASVAGRDVIVVVIDGLRADAEAPFIQSLAAEGLSFSNAAANSSHVMQSLASFFTGRLPSRGGAIGVYEAEPHDEAQTMAEYFQKAGYYTGLLAMHPAIQGKGFTKGFEEIQVAQAGQALDDAALAARAGEFFEDAGSSKAFLYVHFAGPLASGLYRPGTAAEGVATPFTVREFGEKFAAEIAGKPTGAEAFRNRIAASEREYAAAVASADAAVKALVESLRAAGRLEKSLLVLTSLHGFELFEHGFLGPGWTLYEESVRVPLVFYAPGAIAPAAAPQAVSLVDVLPSVLTLAGIAHDGGAWDGRGLFEARGDALGLAPGERTRLAELVIPERCIVRTITQDGWTYLASSLWAEPPARHAAAEAHRDTANAYLDGSKPMPPQWGAGAKEALFKGPIDEELPLADHEQARAPLAMLLDEYQQLCEASGLAARVAVKSVKAVDASQVENLESLGYL